MILDYISDFLTRLYDLPSIDVHPFLLAADSAEGRSDLGRETLLIHATPNAVEIGLYIDPTVLSQAASYDVAQDADAIACCAEGVSHLLYTIDRISRSIPMSELELELQGEVDAFLVLQLLALETHVHHHAELFAQQFEQRTFHTHLSTEQRHRYAVANAFGARFCHRLRRNGFFPFRHRRLRQMARDFQRCGLRGKIAQTL